MLFPLVLLAFQQFVLVGVVAVHSQPLVVWVQEAVIFAITTI
jgi:hypothetical protein